LAGRPWAFERQILVIDDFDGKTPPSQMIFTSTPIWVQVHDLPLLCMSKAVGAKIGESLGRLEDIDLAGDGVGWGRCLRLRVHIDLSKPLERGRALHLGGQSYWVMFKYEKLPMFCFLCGRVVHGRLGCPVRRDSNSHAAEEKKDWGTWLRVEVRRPYYEYEGGGQPRRTRTAAEDSQGESGSVGRQAAFRNSSVSEKLGGAPQLRGADGGVASGQSRSCGVREEALEVTGGGMKPPTRTCTGKTPGLPRTAACHDHEDVQERVSGEMVASLPESM
jgi:hypothetical protein